MTLIRKIYQQFINILYIPISSNSIFEIRKLCSIIKELDIDIIEYLKKFVIEYKYINKKILDICVKNDYMIKNSYRSLIQNEKLIIDLNIHINNSI